MSFTIAAAAILFAMTFVIARAILGPSVFDRLMAGSVLGTLAILLVAVTGFLLGRPEWLDIALTYGLLNLISTFAVLKFVRYGDLTFWRDEDQT